MEYRPVSPSSRECDWYVQFVSAWVVQETMKLDDYLTLLLAATQERCRRVQERHPELSVSLDAVEYLNKAARRVARRIFGGSTAMTAEKGAANVPAPYPLSGDTLGVFVAWDRESGFVRHEVPVSSQTDVGLEYSTVAVRGGDRTAKIRLFPHATYQHRAMTLLRKLDEVIGETVDKAIEGERSEEGTLVRDLQELIEARDRGIAAVEARLLLRQLIAETGVATFVRWIDNTPDSSFLDNHPDLFPEDEVERERERLRAKEMKPEAIRQTKCRALQVIQKAAVTVLGRSSDAGTARRGAAGGS